MKMPIKIFANAEEATTALAEDFYQSLEVKERTKFTAAFSGGNTPRLFFQKLAQNYAEKIDWPKVHLFWVDERCVPPDHADSNYGLVRKTLLDFIAIPPYHVHRIRGEDDPEKEALRYHQEIDRYVIKSADGWPVFDWMFLGLGTDGHTASLFTMSQALQPTDHFCLSTSHPQTGQRRLTLTLDVINHCKRVIFLVTGAEKAEIIAKIFQDDRSAASFPATLVQPVVGKLHWYLDQQAAARLASKGAVPLA